MTKTDFRDWCLGVLKLYGGDYMTNRVAFGRALGEHDPELARRFEACTAAMRDFLAHAAARFEKN